VTCDEQASRPAGLSPRAPRAAHGARVGAGGRARTLSPPAPPLCPIRFSAAHTSSDLSVLKLPVFGFFSFAAGSMMHRARQLAVLVLAAGWCTVSPVVPEAGLCGVPAAGAWAGVAAPGVARPLARRLRGGSDAGADACDSSDEGTAPCDEHGRHISEPEEDDELTLDMVGNFSVCLPERYRMYIRACACACCLLAPSRVHGHLGSYGTTLYVYRFLGVSLHLCNDRRQCPCVRLHV